MTYVADDIVMVTGAELLAAFGDDQTTVLPCLEIRTPASRRMP
jgi:hypothetical protein